MDLQGLANENKERVNKSVKKCLLHLSGLSKIYDAFPGNIFDSVFGKLANTVESGLLAV